MSGFRGSDERLAREIATVERLVGVRLRRASDDLRELERALADLRREQRRRQRSEGASSEPTYAFAEGGAPQA
jgi:hypothetical protein